MEQPLERITRHFARKRPRPAVAARCHLATQPSGPNLALAIRDVSPGGLGLITTDVLPKNQQVQIEIASPGAPTAVKRLGVVVWSQPSESTFLAGISFDEMLAFNDFQSISQP